MPETPQQLALRVAQEQARLQDQAVRNAVLNRQTTQPTSPSVFDSIKQSLNTAFTTVNNIVSSVEIGNTAVTALNSPRIAQPGPTSTSVDKPTYSPRPTHTPTFRPTGVNAGRSPVSKPVAPVNAGRSPVSKPVAPVVVTPKTSQEYDYQQTVTTPFAPIALTRSASLPVIPIVLVGLIGLGYYYYQYNA